MRLFIAINFNNEIKDTLCDNIQRLKTIAAKGDFTHRENLHLTLVFIGETTNVSAIKNAMETVNTAPFDLHMGELGKFKRDGGDIYWVGVEKNNALTQVYNHLSKELIKSGFKIENREFKPHLTIGRGVILNNAPTDEIPEMDMKVFKISLMKSERINGKLTYTEIYSKDL